MVNLKKIKIVFLLGIITSFFACNTEEYENRISDLQQDSLETSNFSQEQAEQINDYMRSINEIQENLALIKEKENIITVNFDKGNAELDETDQDRIIGDITLINNLLQENKQKVASLNSRLRKSNVKLTELEKLIENLALQIQAKDSEIADLQTQLANVNDQLKVLFDEYNNRVMELGETTNKLNTAYYCYGTFKELKEQGVVTKEGGFIGMGRTEKLSDNFNKQYFTQVDITQLSEIELLAKKAKLVTTHPSGSYKIEGGETAEKLQILNSEDFWESSKYLVIIVEN